MQNRPLTLALCLLGALLTGCTTSWQDHYQGAPQGSFAPTESVTVREVPWSRVEATLGGIDEGRAASDTHWDEWSEDQRLQEQAALLSGLQISEDPRDIIVLGRSVFRSTDHLRPEDGSLAEFAKTVGADYAVWSAHYLGTRRVTETRSVTEHGGRYRSYTDASGVRRRSYEPWDRTVFVPVVVDADEYAWIVYYLRRR